MEEIIKTELFIEGINSIKKKLYVQYDLKRFTQNNWLIRVKCLSTFFILY